MIAAPLLVLALALQSPSADSLRTLARELPESALVVQAKGAPLATREAVGGAIRAGEIETARRLAAAYARAWQDPFLAREVARFAAWSPERRAAKLWADSVRREGIAAFGREGADAAISIWRRASRRAQAIPDTALAAAIAGNMGVAFLHSGSLDSARTHLTRAVAWARSVDDRRVEANAVVAIAGVDEDRGDLAAARAGYARALTLYERIGDTRGIAAARNNLGLLAWRAGDHREARHQFEAALALNRRDGSDEAAATNQVNLAGLASLAGDFARARVLYGNALSTWRAREAWADAADALFGLGQLELRRGDYAAAVDALQEALAIYDRTGPVTSALAVRRMLAGGLGARGDLQGAVDALGQADSLATASGVGAVVSAGIVLARADLAVRLNALSDAEGLYERAQRLYRAAADPDGEAEARHGRGLLRLERGDFPGAIALFEASLRAQEAGGNGRAAALTRLALSRGARAVGDTALALRHLERAVSEMERVGDPVGHAAALGEQAELEVERGLPASAEALYRDALAGLDGRFAPDVAWRLHAGLAEARRVRGALDDAARSLRAAITEIERAGGSLALPERRAGFMADKWDVYEQLARVERERGLPGTAFEVSERLRAREMLELLGRGRIEPATAPVGELVGREQDLRRRISELTDAMGGAAVTGSLRGPPIGSGGDATREELLAAQAAYSALLLELRERAPRHAALLNAETAGWRNVARRLRRDEAFIEYLVGDSGSVAYVVVRDSLAIVDLGIARPELARLVAFARGTVEAPRPGTDSLWLGPFRRLHRHLIAPIEATGLLAGKTRLLLVPHAELHYLPFAALVGGRDGRPLVERFELAVTPSATVWLALGDRPRSPGKGVLAMAPRPGVLPGSSREVAAIARLVGSDAQVLVGDQATEAAFLRAARSKRIVHLATFGALNKHNPLFSFLEFAPGGGGDRRLEVHEVFGLDLAADLVVLSACQTGLGSGRLADVPPGDDWVGLTRAFLHAGAEHVAATLWAVEDQPTAALMEEFYRHYLGGSEPSRALAEAQRALSSVPDAHPFYWAGFVVVEGSAR